MSSPPPQQPLVRAMPVPTPEITPPQQAAGEHVLHDGRGGDGHDAEEDGIGGGTKKGVAEKHVPQGAVGDDKQRDVQYIIDNAREVEGQGLDAQQCQQNAPQQLAEAHHAAGDQSRRTTKRLIPME